MDEILTQLGPTLWELFIVFLSIFGPIAITAISLLARKYLKGRAKLVYLTVERHGEDHLTFLLRQAIDYANEQEHKSRKDRKKEGIDKLGIATDAAMVLLKNSSMPHIGQKRLEELIEQELGAMRRTPTLAGTSHKGV